MCWWLLLSLAANAGLAWYLWKHTAAVGQRESAMLSAERRNVNQLSQEIRTLKTKLMEADKVIEAAAREQRHRQRDVDSRLANMEGSLSRDAEEGRRQREVNTVLEAEVGALRKRLETVQQVAQKRLQEAERLWTSKVSRLVSSLVFQPASSMTTPCRIVIGGRNQNLTRSVPFECTNGRRSLVDPHSADLCTAGRPVAARAG